MMKSHPPGNYVKARNGLPETQKPVFDDIVADFSHATNLHDKTGYVPYYALSEMVRMGWRLTEEPDDSRRQMRLLEVALQALGPAGPPDLHEFFYKDSPCGTVASSYKRTGDLLCRLLEDNPDKSLIFPMLFCYRHFIEVNLKGLLLLAGVDIQAVLNEKRNKKNPHSLVVLHQILSVRLPDNAKTATIGKKTSVQKELKRISEWAARMNKVDPKSDRFRYAEDKRSRPYDFPDLHSLFQLSELSVLHTEMERLNESFYHVAIVLVGPPETEGSEAN